MKFKTFLNETANQQLDVLKSRSYVTDLRDIEILSKIDSRSYSGFIDLSYNKLKTLDGLPDKYVYKQLTLSSNQQLESLHGCPDVINGNLLINDCKMLASLEYSATLVHDDFDVSGCSITSLQYSPTYVGGDFCIQNNKLTSLVSVDDYLDVVKGSFYIVGNPITEGGLGLLLTKVRKVELSPHTVKFSQTYPLRGFVQIMSKYMFSKNRTSVIYDCQQELINNNLEEYAKI